MDEYLRTLLEQIRCKKARTYICQELQNHIEDQIDANLSAGMSSEDAEKEAVKDMGDPVEAGIALDRIHRPQIAWKLLFLIALLSITGILFQTAIGLAFGNTDGYSSSRYITHVIIGLVVMCGLYLLDYTLLAKYSKIIALLLIMMCFSTFYFGNMINGMRYFSLLGYPIPAWSFMLFYVPVYGGILYKYRGRGYAGLLRAALWMILPVILVLRLPSITIAGLLLASMLVMLTIAIQKGWFTVQKTLALSAIWCIFLVIPCILLLGLYYSHRFAPYQMARIQAFISDSEANYIQSLLHSFLHSSNLIGSSGMNAAETLPEFRADYILTCLTSMYGIIPAILLCCVIAVLIATIFHTAFRQKNQLGLLMGCGCGMVFLISFLVNVLENVCLLPSSMTFLPFISAGGSHIVVSYGLLGIVLSIYKCKNIYPQHVNVSLLKNE